MENGRRGADACEHDICDQGIYDQDDGGAISATNELQVEQ
jgi:hypothetical protein